jgi:hypothetical protein
VSAGFGRYPKIETGTGRSKNMRNGENSAGRWRRLNGRQNFRRAARLCAILVFALSVSGCGSIGALFDSSAPDQDRISSGEVDSPSIARPPAMPSEGASAALQTDLTNFKERLFGLSPERIEALFGSPSLARAEPPATIWQYRQPGCTVDIFLFETGGVTRVDHVDVRGARAGVVDERTCFRENLQKNISGGVKGG